jgi:hypothetical protein
VARLEDKSPTFTDVTSGSELHPVGSDDDTSHPEPGFYELPVSNLLRNQHLHTYMSGSKGHNARFCPEERLQELLQDLRLCKDLEADWPL